MKIIVVQTAVPGITPEQFAPYLEAETRQVWALTQANVLREMYFRQDKPGAVMIFECASVDEVNQHLNTLPLVAEGLIAFDLIPLSPYSGLARLFAKS